MITRSALIDTEHLNAREQPCTRVDVARYRKFPSRQVHGALHGGGFISQLANVSLQNVPSFRTGNFVVYLPVERVRPRIVDASTLQYHTRNFLGTPPPWLGSARGGWGRRFSIILGFCLGVANAHLRYLWRMFDMELVDANDDTCAFTDAARKRILQRMQPHKQ